MSVSQSGAEAAPGGVFSVTVRVVFRVILSLLLLVGSAGVARADDAAGKATSPTVTPKPEEPRRPSLLLPMYVSFSTLQALDYHSTTRALSTGAGREANPLMRSVVDNRPAFIAVKAAATTAIVWQAERMWKKHPVGAVIFMAAANGAMAAVVAHNYRR